MSVQVAGAQPQSTSGSFELSGSPSQGELVLVKNGRKAVPLGAGVSDLLSPFDTEHYVLLGA